MMAFLGLRPQRQHLGRSGFQGLSLLLAWTADDSRCARHPCCIVFTAFWFC